LKFSGEQVKIEGRFSLPDHPAEAEIRRKASLKKGSGEFASGC